jgi:lysophospholipase
MTGINHHIDFFRTHDGLCIRYGRWSLPGRRSRGSIVVLQGRTEYIEKYEEVIGFLTAKGFWVYTFEWRGQGLSSRMLRDPRLGHVHSFEDYLKDLKRLLESRVFPDAPQPVLLLGHSMGGHLALRHVHDHPETVRSAVLTSPMIDIITFPAPRVVLRAVVELAVKTGLGDACLPGTRLLHSPGFRGNPLTSDKTRFDRMTRTLKRSPHLSVSGVTFQWLDAAFRSIDILASSGYAGAIEVPVLLASAQNDRVVCNRSQRLLCQTLPGCRLINLPGARHEILQETDAIQAIFWKGFDGWLRDLGI